MFTPTAIVVFIAVGVFIVLTFLFIMIKLFYKEIKQWIHKQIYLGIKGYHNTKRKYGALWNIFLKIKGNELSYTIDIIFQLFVHFYKIHIKEMEEWAFNIEHFPNGRKDVSDIFYWITKVRLDNYDEMHHLINEENHIAYFGTTYKRFNFRINHKGELIISPSDDDTGFTFEKKMMKMQNTLYALDTEKCLWILERRRYFGF